MLSHHAGKWSTDCDRCKSSIEIVGEPDKRGKRVELAKAAEFLASLGWQRLHRKGAGDRVNWWCRGCVVAVARNGMRSTPHTTAGLDMNPKPEKKGA